jgi:hypothetical protein
MRFAPTCLFTHERRFDRKRGDTPQTDSNDPEELAHYDDAVIGRAFRGSFIALAIIVLGGGIGFYITNRKPAPAPAKVTPLVPPEFRQSPRAELPNAAFTDITAAAGIAFVHNNGAYGDKLLPETMGGGAAFFDCDNDGDQDLLFINSTYWPEEVPPGKQPTTHALYRNDGQGKFTDATAGSGLDVSLYGMGVRVETTTTTAGSMFSSRPQAEIASFTIEEMASFKM